MKFRLEKRDLKKKADRLGGSRRISRMDPKDIKEHL